MGCGEQTGVRPFLHRGPCGSFRVAVADWGFRAHSFLAGDVHRGLSLDLPLMFA